MRINKMFLLAWLLAASVLVVLWAGLPKDAFYSSDGGIKLVQLKSLIANNYRNVSLEYLGQDIDPNSAISPFQVEPLLYIKDGRNYSVFPIAFPFLSSFFYRIWGYPGLYIIPIAASLFSLLLVYAIARQILDTGMSIFIMLATLFATPVLFYSLTFWEHMLATCLLLSAIYILLRFEFGLRSSVIAGSLLGLAIWFRTEMLLLNGILLLGGFASLHKHRAMLFLGLGMALPAGALFAFNKVVYGHWLQHLALNWQASPLQDSSDLIGMRLGFLRRSLLGLNLPQTLPQTRAGWENTMKLIGEDSRLESLAGIALVGILVASIVGFFIARYRNGLGNHVDKAGNSMGSYWSGRIAKTQMSLLGILGAVTIAYLVSVRNDQSPLLTNLASGGLFTFTPIFGLALMWPYGSQTFSQRHRAFNWLFVSTLAFLPTMSILAPNDGGIRHGARYLLPVMPLLVIFGLAATRHNAFRFGKAVVGVLVLGLLVVSISVQARGYRILQQKKQVNHELTHSLLETGADRFVYNKWWTVFNTAPVMVGEKVHVVGTPRNLPKLIRNARLVGDEMLVYCAQGRVLTLPLAEERSRVKIIDRQEIIPPYSTYFCFTVFSLQILP